MFYLIFYRVIRIFISDIFLFLFIYLFLKTYTTLYYIAWLKQPQEHLTFILFEIIIKINIFHYFDLYQPVIGDKMY